MRLLVERVYAYISQFTANIYSVVERVYISQTLHLSNFI